MTGDDRRRLSHVVLPRRLPGLALLERYFPSPADNLLDAELTAFGAAGDTVLDPWAGTGWTARRALAHGMRAIAADPSPFAQLAGRAFLQAPDPSAIDAALGQLAAARRVDVPLAQHLDELYASALRRVPPPRRRRAVRLAAAAATRRRARSTAAKRATSRWGAGRALRAGRRARPGEARHRPRAAGAGRRR